MGFIEDIKPYVDWKKLWIFLSVSLIIILAIFVFCKKNSSTILNENQQKLITSNVNYSAIENISNSIAYYDKTDGFFKKIDLTSKETKKISKKSFANVYYVSWSRNLKYAIFSNSTSDNNDNYLINTFLLDISTGQEKKMLLNPDSVSWSPDSKQIAYSSTDGERNEFTVSISQPDGANTKKIKAVITNGANLKISWATENTIVVLKPYFNPPENPDFTEKDKASKLVTLNIANNSTKEHSTSKASDFSVSPDGQKILFSETENNDLILISDNSIQKISNFPVTSFDSVSWSKLEVGTIYSLFVNFSSNNLSLLEIYKLNLKNNTTAKIYSQNGKVSEKSTDQPFPDNIILSADEKSVYFVSNEKLYQIIVNQL